METMTVGKLDKEFKVEILRGNYLLSNVDHYGVEINLTMRDYNGNKAVLYDIYRNPETGNIYIVLKDQPFCYPIPLNFKFD